MLTERKASERNHQESKTAHDEADCCAVRPFASSRTPFKERDAKKDEWQKRLEQARADKKDDKREVQELAEAREKLAEAQDRHEKTAAKRAERRREGLERESRACAHQEKALEVLQKRCAEGLSHVSPPSAPDAPEAQVAETREEADVRNCTTPPGRQRMPLPRPSRDPRHGPGDGPRHDAGCRPERHRPRTTRQAGPRRRAASRGRAHRRAV